MTKYFDWARVKDMDSRQKSDINMSSTFAEQRKKEKKEKVPKDFGIKRMEEEVNIDWGKSVYDDPQRQLQKLAIANEKADQMKEETATEKHLESEDDIEA